MFKNFLRNSFNLVAMATVLFLSGCATTPPATVAGKDGPPKYAVDVSKIKEPVPQKLPLNKFANKPYYKVNGHTYHVAKSYKDYNRTGTASWYGTKFDGHLTSTGDQYNMLKMTAASTTLPIPCFAKVTNLANGQSIVVEVNDRGPFEKNRLIDLSYAAALKLDIVGHGTAHVRVTGIDPEHYNPHETMQVASHTKTKGPIYIQAAAVHDKVHATTLANQLKSDLHEPASVYAADNKGKTIYRVKIGPIYNSDKAADLVAKMQADGIANPIYSA